MNHKIIKQTFPIVGMSCASCAGYVTKTLQHVKGVLDVSVNFAAATATIKYDSDITTAHHLQEAVKGAGYELFIPLQEEGATTDEQGNSTKTTNRSNPGDSANSADSANSTNPADSANSANSVNSTDSFDPTGSLAQRAAAAQSVRYIQLKRRTIWAIFLSIPLVVLGMFFMNMPFADFIMWILATPLVFWIGQDFYKNAWRQLRHRSANMDTLVALSTGIAYFFSLFNLLFPTFWSSRGVHPQNYFEASGVIITFILLGKLLEERAKGNTASAIKKLMGLQPQSATIINANGVQVKIPIRELKPTDVVVVKPGEKIAVDGVVVEGSSYVDESMLSGEPVPVLKAWNTQVYAGTINQKGSFYFRAEKVGADTMLANIIRLVQQAQQSKAPVQKLVDKIASVFVPVIIGVALLSLILWLVFDPAEGLSHGLLAMVTVLIIACPCALGLATPTAIMVGIGKGAEKGILIKDAQSLETAKKVTAVVLDKTGTITEGKPVVTELFWLQGNDADKSIFYSLEKLSEHPLANAVTEYFGEIKAVQPEQFESITGKGIMGYFGGEKWFAGNTKLLEENTIEIDPSIAAMAEKWQKESKTVILFANHNHALAAVAITDKIKASSATAIDELKKSGITTYMLTGDHHTNARVIAATVGIDHYKAEALPGEKAEFIKELQQQGEIVAMVGDGINDSAALAQADLGIAMGKGSDIAMDVAKMTIISSDLTKIPQAIRLSGSTVRTIRQNLFWAFIYNIIGVPIAAGILYPFDGFLLNPMIAGAAMALSSVSVVTNSLRLKLH